MPWSLDRRALTLLVIGLFALAASGCGGDDGDDGKSAVVGVRTSAPDRLIPRINDVSLSSPLVVDFQVTDGNGLGVPGITGGVSFTVNKLMPGTDGSNSHWQSYILADDEGTANAQPGTYGDGTLVDHGDGTYTFTFADELEDISGVSFVANRTHRIGIELRDVNVFGEELNGSGNGVLDFRPSGGGTQERAIVKNESCETCHGGPPPFNFHGGPRNDVEYCVTCHQPNAIDVGTGNSIEFSVVVHKIHAATDDAQWCGFACEAFGAPPDDFSNVHYPQSVRNCTNCHDPNDPATPQADLVNNGATAEVCASCHTDLAFDDNGLTNVNDNHPAGPQPDSNCATCHSEGGLVASVLESHVIPEQVWGPRFAYNILSVSQTSEGQSPIVTFSVTDPTNGDAAYDLVNDPEFTGSETSVNMDIAWPTSDYTNVANNAGDTVTGGPPSRPISIGLVSGSGLGAGVTSNGDGTYTVDTSDAAINLVIPATTPALGSGAVVIEGHVSGDFDGDGTFDDSVPVFSAVDYFAINDSRAQARRDVVDPAKCQDCHSKFDGLAFHGDNRTDNTQVCVVCHNPNQTDLFMRPADTDGTFNGQHGDTAVADNLEDRTIDFKYMIHAIHRGADRDDPYIAYGFGVTPHNYGDRHFPRPMSDCLACHVDEASYELPLDSDVLATTLSSGSTVTATVTGFANPGATEFDGDGGTNDGSESDPTDDNNASATAAVCSSCHDSTEAANHMDSASGSPVAFGNAVLLPDPDYPGDPGTDTQAHTQSVIDGMLPGGENCAFCHGPGGFVDVVEVHAAAGVE